MILKNILVGKTSNKILYRILTRIFFLLFFKLKALDDAPHLYYCFLKSCYGPTGCPKAAHLFWIDRMSYIVFFKVVIDWPDAQKWSTCFGSTACPKAVKLNNGKIQFKNIHTKVLISERSSLYKLQPALFQVFSHSYT